MRRTQSHGGQARRVQSNGSQTRRVQSNGSQANGGVPPKPRGTPFKFLEKYNITDIKQIPTISYFSPVSQVLGIRPGDICKIERFSEVSSYLVD